MEIKKSPKADLESKKSTWMLMGYIIVLSVVFVAFEWSERDKQIDLTGQIQDVQIEEEIIPITEMEVKPPPPPPPKQVIEEIQIVDDEEEVPDVEIESTEETNQAVEIGPIIVEEETEPEVSETEIFNVVEKQASFPGGDAALMKFLNDNIKYPTISQENGTQGRVYIQFVVNIDGSIQDAVVMRSLDPYLDKEALRVVNMMPKWNPGEQRNKAVRSRFTLPVLFRLQ
ncbi:MAG: energy transducer TonB [Prevotellaceae bacterium]|jgi:protein TonB|nr:energy transducer TonB [Prevotellaceae bacterium]